MVFATKGFAQVGMRELATQIGVSPGALYHHYPSKQHLLFDFIEEFYDELLAALDEIEKEDFDPVGSVIERHLDLHARLHWHFRVALCDEASLTPDQQDEVMKCKARHCQKLSELLKLQSMGSRCAALATSQAIAVLLSTIPVRVTGLPMDALNQRLLLESLLRGAIESLLTHTRDHHSYTAN